MKYELPGTKRFLELRYALTDKEKSKPFLLVPSGEANVYRILCDARLENDKLRLTVKTWNDAPEYKRLQPIVISTPVQIEFANACLDAMKTSKA